MRLSSLISLLALTGCSLAVGSGTTGEVCDNRVDDDFDGRMDCADPDCAGECPNGSVAEPDLQGTCSGSWRSSRDGAHCEPWDARDWSECASDRYRPTTTESCISIGDGACELPTRVLLPGNVYVNWRAAPGGDGSLDAPYDSLQAAIDGAAPFSTIVFDGEFELNSAITKDLTLQGLCPAASRIVGGLEASAFQLWLRNLELANADGPALTVNATREPAAEVALADVLVEGSVSLTSAAGGERAQAHLNAERSAFHGPVLLDDFGGLLASGSTFSTRGAVPCIEVPAFASATLRDVVLEKCGLKVTDGYANVSHSLFERLLTPAITVDCLSSDFPCVTVGDSLFRRSDVGTEPMVRLVRGNAAISGSVFVDGEGPAIRMDDGRLTMENCSVVQPAIIDAAGDPGTGVELTGGSAELETVAIEGYGPAGIALRGGELTATELILRGDPDAAVDGIVAESGSSLTIDDFLFEGPGDCAYRLQSGLTLAIANGTIETDEAGFCIPPASYDRAIFTEQITQRGGATFRETPASE